MTTSSPARTAAPNTPQRKIVHADCDSFFASVEMRDNPALNGKPLAVGGRPDQRGVVATCNYEARRYGIHSAMPMSQAQRLCPGLVMVRTDIEKYRAVSAQIRGIFERYTSIIEPLSLDEAYLDVTGSDQCRGSATLIATAIRDAVRSELGITISAGIAPNKFLAKIASDWNKPDGQFTIAPHEVQSFVAKLAVEKLHGVGEATAERLHALGVSTCSDLRRFEMTELVGQFGAFGARLYQLCRGEDDRPVKTDRIRKSVSVEHTFPQDLHDSQACQAYLETLMGELDGRIARADVAGRIEGCFVKLRFSGFETTTASSIGTGLDLEAFRRLLENAWSREQKPVRLIGLGVRLKHPSADNQIDLFAPN